MANPTEEDLRVAREIVESLFANVGTSTRLIRRIARMRAEQREKDAKIVESFARDIHMEMTDGGEIADAIRSGRNRDEVAAAESVRAGDKE